ncbi:hypothetical protein BpHYR1_003939 [Brachionus plicatilis]|uniref:Uncharacterized protein n=1 Tax=Brachionus plicatilis TaxID=10195 RepID=A0A3M7QAP4_BRAPC|nr:hypothetical protein BpHYR1_003939 [Brachionus plicatilis]
MKISFQSIISKFSILDQKQDYSSPSFFFHFVRTNFILIKALTLKYLKRKVNVTLKSISLPGLFF